MILVQNNLQTDINHEQENHNTHEHQKYEKKKSLHFNDY